MVTKDIQYQSTKRNVKSNKRQTITRVLQTSNTPLFPNHRFTKKTETKKEMYHYQNLYNLRFFGAGYVQKP